MSDKQLDRFVSSAHENGQGKRIKITREVVMAVTDRIYGRLLRELKIERERQRFLDRPHR